MLLKQINKELFADYFQFYLQDEGVSGDLSESWTDEAVERHLALAEGTIGIGTIRNLNVPVIVKIFDEEPDIQSNQQYDKINECDIITNSNKMVNAGCTDYFPEAERIDVNKGIYRARIYYGNLSKLSEDELNGKDFYEIHLWQIDEKKGIKIIKGNNASA